MNNLVDNAFRFLTAIIVSVAAVLPARADPSDEAFIEGLRARRLFSLAETYCRDRLAETDLDDADRADLVIDLARTFAGHALNSLPADRGTRWQAARDAVADFLRDHSTNPRRFLVQVQDALTVLARGELARQEAEVAAAGAPSLEEAREQLREAIGMLAELEEETAESIRRRNQGPRVEDNDLTIDELLSLRNHVQYQLARAYRNQALCYPAETADRANSLTQAAKKLAPLARRETNDRLTWKARIDAVVCARLLGDLDAATARLEVLEKANLPVDAALAAHAESIRLELARKNPEAALKLLQMGRQIQGQTLPELDYAVLETFIALWQAAAANDDEEKAKQWQEKAAQTVRLIEHLHGPYWLRRAETLLARSASKSGAGNLELLVRAAENFYRRGQLDDALAQFDQAALQSVDAGRADEAFELWYKAAAIEHQRPGPHEAMRRFRDLALDLPENPRAPKAHLLAVLNASTVARETDPPDLAQYETLLLEHLKNWPQSDQGDQARWWLGRLYEHRQEWTDALTAYRGISTDYPKYASAIRATARCWQRRLSEMPDDEQSREEKANEAASWFDNVLPGDSGQPPGQWTEAQRVAVIEAAKIRLTYTKSGFAAAKGVLDAALKNTEGASDQWLSEAQMLQVVALAGLERRDEATDVLRRLSGGNESGLMEMIEGLRSLAAGASDDVRRDLANLQLTALDLIKPLTERLSPADRQTVQTVHAEALAAAGRRDQALPQYERLASAQPNSGLIQEGYASLLQQNGDRESLERALAQWRTVASRSPPGSDRWYRAKYGLAEVQFLLGNKDRAASLIKYLETLHPELGGDEMHRQFRALLRRCEQ